jgi:hypothetical protein
MEAQLADNVVTKTNQCSQTERERSSLVIETALAKMEHRK